MHCELVAKLGAMTMKTSIEPLGELARAAAAGASASGDAQASAAPPRTDNVPMAVRLDFAALLTAAEREATARPDSPFGLLPQLPAVVYAAWRIRIDLHRSFDLATAAGYAGLWMWAIRDGRREVETIAAAVMEARPVLTGAATVAAGARMPVSFPWIAALLWCTRPDLQDAYPVSDPLRTAAYLGWFLRNGIFEARCGDLLPADHVALLAGVEAGAAAPPLTRYFEFAHAARPDLLSAFDLGGFDGRRDYIKWFFRDGEMEFPSHPDILSRQAEIVFAWGQTLGAGPPASGDVSA